MAAKYIVLTRKQADFLLRLLRTHVDVCDLDTAELCSAVLKKVRTALRPARYAIHPPSTRANNSTKE